MKEFQTLDEIQFKNDRSILAHLKNITEKDDDILKINDSKTDSKIRLYIRILNIENPNIKTFEFNKKEYPLRGEVLIKIGEDELLLHEEELINIKINNNIFNLRIETGKYFWLKNEEVSTLYLISEENNFIAHENETKKSGKEHKGTKIIGHRGIGMNKFHSDVLYRENTIGAFRVANSLGARWIELDVHLTNDKIPVVYHDYHKNIDARGNKKFISQMNISEFQYSENFLEKNNFHNFGKDELDFISLEDVFRKANKDCKFNIELKFPFMDSFNHDELEIFHKIPEYVNAVLKIINKYCTRENVFISSFNPEILIYLSLIQNKYDLFFLFENNDICRQANIDIVKAALKISIRYGFKGIVADSNHFCENIKDFVDYFHTSDKLVMLYGDKVNEKEWVEVFLKNKVDGLITDKIDVVLSVANNRTNE